MKNFFKLYFDGVVVCVVKPIRKFLISLLVLSLIISFIVWFVVSVIFEADVGFLFLWKWFFLIPFIVSIFFDLLIAIPMQAFCGLKIMIMIPEVELSEISNAIFKLDLLKEKDIKSWDIKEFEQWYFIAQFADKLMKM